MSLQYSEWFWLMEVYNYACSYCGKRGLLTRDHIQPISKGGIDEIGNVVPCCSRCNTAKADMTLEQWLGEIDVFVTRHDAIVAWWRKYYVLVRVKPVRVVVPSKRRISRYGAPWLSLPEHERPILFKEVNHNG